VRTGPSPTGHGCLQVRHKLETYQTLSISSLQWVVGAFTATLGALMLVSPHQFAAPAYAYLAPHLAWFGPGFLLAGAGLIAVASPAPRLRFRLVAHAAAGAMLLVLAGGFAFSASWTGTTNYTVLGLGTILAPLLVRVRTAGVDHMRGDALSILIGLATTMTGVILVVLPAQFNAEVYEVIRPFLVWYGSVLFAVGLILCFSQISSRVPQRLARSSPLLVAGALFVFGYTVALPSRAWTGIAYYGGFGVALVVLAWTRQCLRRLDPGSLRARLGLVLAAAAAVPILLLTPLYSHEEENQAVSAQLARQQTLASALAHDVADYVSLHQAAVILLAAEPGLLGMSPKEQHLLLESSKAAYSDVNSFSIVAADGELMAQSDDRAGTSWIRDPVFEEARQAGQPTLEIHMSPGINRPVFSIGEPISDSEGNLAGIVSATLESSRVADFLSRSDFGADTHTYLVDSAGRVIAHPDPNLVATMADLSAARSVAAFLSDPGPSGSLRVEQPSGEVLASFAHVPDLGWGVLVERTTASTLAPTRAKLDLLFVGLILAIGAAAGFGVVAAGWLNMPLVTLAAAVDGLAADDDSAPLPTGGLTEVAGLAAAFGTMRARVVGRTAELQAANREVEALYRVAQTITAPLEPDVVLNTIARCTAELLGSDSSAILLVDQASQTLRVQGAYGISERAVRDTRDRIGESIAGRVVQSGRPIIANDVPNNSLFVNPAADEDRLLAVASVPLIVGQMTIGTLDVHSRTNRFAFDDHHIQVLQMLASQAAIALENARLYQALLVARDELEVRVQARTSDLIAANAHLHDEIAVRIEAEGALQEAEAKIRGLYRELELRVVARTAELEAANNELEAFSYTVSHDLRAPLRAINGFSRILLAEHAANLAPEAQEYLELIHNNAGQMGTLIDDLLRFSRMSRQGLRKDLVQTSDVVRDVLASLTPEQEGREVQVVVGQLLPCRADAALLKQLFANLLSNALKFTRQRAIGHVEVGCEQSDGEVVYFVKDDGAGFDMRYADKLFGVFQRLHRSEDYEGTGVGLAIVQRIVQRHGGRLWADGALDNGATFSFTLGERLDSPYKREKEGSDDRDGFATRDAA
jgi:signal transduction histidine kinase/HAMP domain-containing protein